MKNKEQVLELFTKEQLALFTSSDRLAMFIAQCSHESEDFLVTEEKLNYSPSRLLIVFPKYFNKDTANQYAYKPIATANRVYANRMGNGDELSGDGYKYRGRGYIQLTGKSQYVLAGMHLNLDLVTSPDLVNNYLMDCAIWYFENNNILNCTDIIQVTKMINGGTNGITDRKQRYEYYRKLLS